MRNLNKLVSFIAVAACTTGAVAATSRTSVTMASRRMPALSKNVVTASTTTSSTANLLDNIKCIDAYSECIKADDACGPNFEECTTRVLFHAQMPKCVSTLAQCSSAGVSSLFGTSNTSALATGATKNEYDEITDYTYPTDNSVLGQLITAGAISNQYDTATCVKRYTNCLKKDSVCGADFELCTSNSEFKRQSVLCDSTLARCQSDAKKELFGDANLAAAPKSDSRIGQMITEGAGLAAVNMVSTCYKVADQCIMNACTVNPIACQEGASAESINAAYEIEGQELVVKNTENATSRDVNAFIKAACLNTIGANKYCYAVVEGNGVMPTSKQLLDEDVWDTVYGDIYDARMNAALKGKIGELIAKFDTRAKDKCAATIQSCAMRACGEGVGAVCYTSVYGTGGAKTINTGTPLEEIKTGCADLVNTDPNCIYAALNANNTGISGYTADYMYANATAFETLFPAATDGETTSDPIGAVAQLNATLATSYNAAAIADMRKQCQNVATSCVRSLCGTDYMNCYRSRTDVYSNLTNTGDEGSAFDKSMNKVGGVLDYTIVLGLCLDTIKNADICEEHLAIERARYKKNDGTTDSWGDATSVRGGWIDAGSATKVDIEKDTVPETDANGNKICTPKDNNNTLQGPCGTVDENGNYFSEPVMIEYTTYVQSQAAQSLFKDLIYDLEKEAQAKYNAKLTREQQMCMSNNNGGLMGKSDLGGAYMWVKLRNNKVPNDYTVNGLGENHFVASNDLYGSFCRMRVTLQSDDKDIQDAMRDAKWTTAYFAVGDAFTCGSWIPSDALEKIGNRVGCRNAGGVWDGSSCNVTENQERVRRWATALGAVGLGTGGFFAGDAINQAAGLGGLVVGKKKQNISDDCGDLAAQAKAASDKIAGVEKPDEKLNVGDVDAIVMLTSKAVSAANSGKINGANAANALASSLKTKADAFKKVKNAVLKNQRGGNDTLYDCSGNDAEKTGDAICEDGDVVSAAEDVVSAAKTLSNNLGQLATNCDDKYDSEKGKNWIAPAIGTAVGATAGGLILNYAVRDAQEAKLTEAQKAAYDEWMKTVGEHIQCYIGSEEAGTYGTVVQTTVE